MLIIFILMFGCEFDLFLLDVFFLLCCEFDKQICLLIVCVVVNYLQGVFDMLVNCFGVIIGVFGEEQIEEYCVVFMVCGEKEFIYGIVWLVYGCDGGVMDVIVEGELGSLFE